MSDSDRLLVSPRVLAGLLLGLVVVGWLWVRASKPSTPSEPTVERTAGAIPLAEPVRTGTPVPPTLVEVQPRGGCEILLRIPSLGAVSDKGLLDHAGLFDASPLLVLEDGQPLTPHDRARDCSGGFAHGPLGPLVRTTDPDTPHAYTLDLTTDLRATHRRGPAGPTEVLYVHPGTTLEVAVPTAWRQIWGEPVLHLAGVASEAERPASLSLSGAEAPIDAAGGPVRAAVTGEAAVTAFTLTVTSPPNGPVLVITDLVLGEEDAATAVVGTLEGATSEITAPSDAEGPEQPRPAVSRMGRPPHEDLDLDARGDACTVAVPRPDLEDLSDLRLFERYGLKFASPVRVFEDGRAMAAHTRETGCNGGFAHPATGLVLHPSPPGAEGRSYALSWDPAPEVEVGVRGGGQTRISWVYPGTSARFTWSERLRKGPHEVVVDVVSFGGEAPATLSSGNASVDILPAALDQRPSVPGPPGDSWTLSLSSPEDGPIVLVRGFDSRPIEGAEDAPDDAPPLPSAPPTALDGVVLPMELSDEGFVTVLPDGSDAVATAREVGGRPTMRFEVPTPGPGPRLCTAWVSAGDDLTVEAELRLQELVPGDAAWKTARIEDTWQDDDGAIVLIDDKPAMTVHLLGPTDDWRIGTWTFPRPRGGARARACVRFPFATGSLDLARVVLDAGQGAP